MVRRTNEHYYFEKSIDRFVINMLLFWNSLLDFAGVFCLLICFMTILITFLPFFSSRDDNPEPNALLSFRILSNLFLSYDGSALVLKHREKVRWVRHVHNGNWLLGYLYRALKRLAKSSKELSSKCQWSGDTLGFLQKTLQLEKLDVAW